MKLSNLMTFPRPDLEEHPEMQAVRPSPVGIGGMSIQQYDDLPLFQWFVQGRSGHWTPHGEPHRLRDV